MLTSKQLDATIETFLKRKSTQYPDLNLRSGPERGVNMRRAKRSLHTPEIIYPSVNRPKFA